MDVAVAEAAAVTVVTVDESGVLRELRRMDGAPLSIRRTASPWTDSNYGPIYPQRWCPSGAWPSSPLQTRPKEGGTGEENR
jgi:hypothetical protein